MNKIHVYILFIILISIPLKGIAQDNMTNPINPNVTESEIDVEFPENVSESAIDVEFTNNDAKNGTINQTNQILVSIFIAVMVVLLSKLIDWRWDISKRRDAEKAILFSIHEDLDEIYRYIQLKRAAIEREMNNPKPFEIESMLSISVEFWDLIKHNAPPKIIQSKEIFKILRSFHLYVTRSNELIKERESIKLNVISINTEDNGIKYVSIQTKLKNFDNQILNITNILSEYYQELETFFKKIKGTD